MSSQQALLFDVTPVVPVTGSMRRRGAKSASSSRSSPSPSSSSPTTPPSPAAVTNPPPASDRTNTPPDVLANAAPNAAPAIADLRRAVGCILHRPSAEPVLAASTPAAGASDAGATTETPAMPFLSSGSTAIDSMLPTTGRWRGLAAAGITQYVAAAGGSVVGGGSAGSLALAAAAKWLSPDEAERAAALRAGVCRTGPIVVVARRDQFFPPAAVSMGIPMDRIIWVRPESRSDAVWAVDQSLRCPSVSCVWSILDDRLDDRDSRRIQLAAEQGRTPGLIVRPPRAADRRATFAQVSLHVELIPVPAQVCAAAAVLEGRARRVEFDPADPDAIFRRGKPFRTALPNLNHPILKVTLDRCRGRAAGGAVVVQIDDAGRIVNLAPQISQLVQQLGFEPEPHDADSNDFAALGRRRWAATQAAVRLAAQLADPAAVDETDRSKNHRSKTPDGRIRRRDRAVAG